MRPLLIAWILVLAFGQTSADSSRYQQFPKPAAMEGREIWLANCEGCHGWGVADAPIPMNPADWRSRLEQPRSTLYRHAIEGFFGPDDSMMPARGGNPELTDRQVKAAVDYMVRLAEFHISNKPGYTQSK